MVSTVDIDPLGQHKCLHNLFIGNILKEIGQKWGQIKGKHFFNGLISKFMAYVTSIQTLLCPPSVSQIKFQGLGGQHGRLD